MRIKYWKTKEGEQIKLTDLKDIHLANIINYLRERYDVLYEERAVHYNSWELEEVLFDTSEEMFPILKDLLKEYKRRNGKDFPEEEE